MEGCAPVSSAEVLSFMSSTSHVIDVGPSADSLLAQFDALNTQYFGATNPYVGDGMGAEPGSKSSAAGAENTSDAHCWPVLDCSTEDGFALLALNSKTCSVPRHATFEPLPSPPDNMPLSEAGRAFFSSHISWRLQCDTTCAAGRQRSRSSGLCDMVHQFVVQRTISEPLNHRLGVLAASEAATPTRGVARSNLGGFQSRADLFVPKEDAGADRLGSSGRVLHGVVSAAIEELLAMRTPGRPCEPAGDLHSAYAWLNVNQPTDSNLMHIHDPKMYSAVYFVAAGGEGASKAPSLEGRLIFRGGRVSRGASNTYLAVPPEAGSLYVFSGAIPHCVLPYGSGVAQGQPTRAKVAPRVSVAINLTDERDECPPPRP